MHVSRKKLTIYKNKHNLNEATAYENRGDKQCVECGWSVRGEFYDTIFGKLCWVCYEDLIHAENGLSEKYLADQYISVAEGDTSILDKHMSNVNEIIGKLKKAWRKYRKDFMNRVMLWPAEIKEIENDFTKVTTKYLDNISKLKESKLPNMKLHEEFKLYENLWEKISTGPIYSGNLRAYAYFGRTPKDKLDNDHVNYDAPYRDTDPAGKSDDDDYIFSGTREAWIRKLNKIAKHHKIVILEIVDEQDVDVFFASDMDLDTGEEYEDIICWTNTIFSTDELFMKQFSSKPADMITESMDKEYYVELRAYDKDTVKEYDDAENYSWTSEYGYYGTKDAIINKLNQIAQTCDFSFVFIYEGDPYENNCVFEASDTNTITDEEFNKPVIWKNNFITEAPFMADFIKA